MNGNFFSNAIANHAEVCFNKQNFYKAKEYFYQYFRKKYIVKKQNEMDLYDIPFLFQYSKSLYEVLKVSRKDRYLKNEVEGIRNYFIMARKIYEEIRDQTFLSFDKYLEYLN